MISMFVLLLVKCMLYSHTQKHWCTFVEGDSDACRKREKHLMLVLFSSLINSSLKLLSVVFFSGSEEIAENDHCDSIFNIMQSLNNRRCREKKRRSIEETETQEENTRDILAARGVGNVFQLPRLLFSVKRCVLHACVLFVCF